MTTLYYPGYAGPVTIRRDGKFEKRVGSLTKSERKAAILQGRDRPRPLTHDETARAAENRRVDREDRLALEVWFRTSCSRNGKRPRGRAG
jgi:hypothetical protein